MPELDEDTVVNIARGHLSPKSLKAMTITRWKDSIDVEYATSELMEFAHAITAAALNAREGAQMTDEQYCEAEIKRLRAALEEIKGKYAWQTDAGAIARKALTPEKHRTAPLPEGMVRKGGRNVVPDDFERPAPPPAFSSPDKRREE
jgi:hypothetical protein